LIRAPFKAGEKDNLSQGASLKSKREEAAIDLPRRTERGVGRIRIGKHIVGGLATKIPPRKGEKVLNRVFEIEISAVLRHKGTFTTEGKKGKKKKKNKVTSNYNYMHPPAQQVWGSGEARKGGGGAPLYLIDVIYPLGKGSSAGEEAQYNDEQISGKGGCNSRGMVYDSLRGGKGKLKRGLITKERGRRVDQDRGTVIRSNSPFHLRRRKETTLLIYISSGGLPRSEWKRGGKRLPCTKGQSKRLRKKERG